MKIVDDVSAERCIKGFGGWDGTFRIVVARGRWGVKRCRFNLPNTRQVGAVDLSQYRRSGHPPSHNLHGRGGFHAPSRVPPRMPADQLQYDQIQRDIEPYFALAPKEFQKRAAALDTQDHS